MGFAKLNEAFVEDEDDTLISQRLPLQIPWRADFFDGVIEFWMVVTVEIAVACHLVDRSFSVVEVVCVYTVRAKVVEFFAGLVIGSARWCEAGA
jgi:hypothetical protein